MTVTAPTATKALRNAKLLVGGYLGLSVATLLAAFFLRNNTSIVNEAVWIRGGAVVLSALLSFLFAAKAVQGSRRAFVRLRIISTVMVVVITVIIALPGPFPTWLKIEQGVCGLLLLGVVVLVSGRHVRSLFSTK
ncbi:hypothetical protein [Actinocrispum wychmicini]|uniref:Uncharacterized protein n=1 Tax=Actinocrispum wychmicini TaxID=1213861 RepID=A0A4R2J5I4_9PSEU|nr:hypothetical protein [Actinocrispum wychmicini]TCO53177.1 hypothetical protein EV192_111374 [Actinocrispum wychmicini]